MPNIQPQINFLSDEDVNRVHEYSLKVLSTVGMRVDSQRARDCFIKAGCRFQEPDRIFVEPDLVQWAIDAAPGTIDIYKRTGEHAFSLGDAANEQARFGVGATCLEYQDPKTEIIEPFTREHFARVTQLGNTLDQFDLVSYPGILQDFSEREAEIRGTLELVANTTKPVLLISPDPTIYKNIMKMLEEVHGDIGEKPFVIAYVNPVTPLALNEDTTDNMFTSIEYGLPLTFSNYGMSGATTPITASGTLVTMNAELLGGLVLSQLIKEGTPMLLGCLPSVFHMQSMVTAYTPQTMLVNLACAEMMAHYDIPHVGTSGSGPGWGADLTASGMHWMNHLTSCLGKVGLAPDVGSNFDSIVFSPATVIYANEVIRQSRQMAEGFVLDDASVGMDDIAKVGPGGNFLTSDMTMELFMNMNIEHSQIWPTYSLEAWQKKGSPTGHDVLIEHVINIMNNLNVPEDQEALLEKGKAFIEKLNL